MLFGELQGIHHAQHLVDVAAQGQVVHHLVAHDAVAVDQEGAAEGHAAFGFHVIGAADLVLDVGHQGVAHLADAALVHRRVFPRQVGELGIDGDADHFHVALLELRELVVEGDQLGGADEGEIERVEEQYAIFALEIGLQVEVRADLVVAQDGGGGEIGSGFTYQNCHGISFPKNQKI